MPVVIEVIETVDQPKPRIVHVSIRFPQRPAFTSSPEAAQLREERRAVAVMRRETCVTHLVQQNATFGAWSKTALNEDLAAMRLEETVAPGGRGISMARAAPRRARCGCRRARRSVDQTAVNGGSSSRAATLTVK